MNTQDKLHRDSFIKAFFACALGATNDESNPSGGEPLENNFSESDFDPVTKAKLTIDCEAFMDAQSVNLTDHPAEDAGHDFFLSQNGHGAGFFDRDYGTKEQRDALQKASRSFGEANIYVGDDGKLYV